MVLYGLGRPGKLLLPGPCLLGPASSSCRGSCLECLVFSWRFPGGPCRRVLQLPVHKSGVLRYPYFSTPTIVPSEERMMETMIPPQVGMRLQTFFGKKERPNKEKG